MTKMVKEIVDEYKDRRKTAGIETMILQIGSETLTFHNVVNFKVMKDAKLCFDHNEKIPYFEERSTKLHHKDNWKHVVCDKADILLMQETIGEGF